MGKHAAWEDIVDISRRNRRDDRKAKRGLEKSRTREEYEDRRWN